MRTGFCDVSPLSFSPDLAHLKSLIARKSIKAIIVVPMWGYPLEMKAVVEFCHSQGIKVIEDCAHAFGTRSDNAFLGTLGTFPAFQRTSANWSVPARVAFV